VNNGAGWMFADDAQVRDFLQDIVGNALKVIVDLQQGYCINVHDAFLAREGHDHN
jgi:hypothetical protein